ncbi:MAG: bifunctional glutamate N-acetyltransferase/amino-acid acetyltransferase ArgJ [Lachnospiraceae bacterium]|nr:bifunctional glutamate N-acetyltransferase/amino-acid acetyltransferase ArgJ [Lachnospiraceae bacterium]
MEIINGGVNSPIGFETGGTEAGIKYQNRKDMAIIYSQKPCVAAATFTSNVVKAAPVKWDREMIDNSPFVQAVIVNTGIANAGTGVEGYEACRQTASEAAKILGIPENSVLVGSTGVIGPQLPLDRIKAGIAKLAGIKSTDRQSGTDASRAIMTTDTVNKEFAVQLTIGGRTVTIGAMSKGSGMIHPNMCTMLSYVCTDAVISKETLTKLVKEDVVDTYNMISVDGDTSTNDTFIVMANGMAENPEICEGTADYEAFREALHFVNETQAKRLAGDGEGANALIECVVVNAGTKADARTLAKSVICSSLTKAAVFGHDANWGRILCALGYSGAQFDPEHMELFYEGKKNGRILIYKDGAGTDYSEEEASAILSEDEVRIIADMKMGTQTATAWGCDLTFDYVKINADYRS